MVQHRGALALVCLVWFYFLFLIYFFRLIYICTNICLQKYAIILKSPNIFARKRVFHLDSPCFSIQNGLVIILSSLILTTFFLLRSSISPPSILHRSSIETMDHRWTIDGVSMEYPIWKKGKCVAFAPWRIENVPLARRGLRKDSACA